MTDKTFSQAKYLGVEAAVGLLTSILLIALMSQMRGEVFLGQYVVLTTWIAISQSFANLGTSDLILREIGKQPEQGGHLFGAGLVICGTSSVLTTGIMCAVVHALHYPLDMHTALLIGSLLLLPMAASTLAKSAYIARHKVSTYVSIVVIEYLVLFFLNSYFVMYNYGIVTLMTTMLFAKVVSSAGLLYVLNTTVFKVQWGLHTELIRCLLGPLGAFSMVGLSAKIFWRVDILMLSKMTTLGATGLYTSAAKFLEIYAMLPSMVAQTMFPDLARQYAMKQLDRNNLETAFQSLCYLVVPLSIGTFVFAKPILLILFGERFASAAPALQLFMLTFIILTIDMLMSITYEAAGYQRNQMYIALGNILINIVLNAFLIPIMSFFGACLATFCSLSVSACVHQYLLARSVFRLRWGRILATPLALGCAAVLPVLLFRDQLHVSILGVAYVVLYGLLLIAVRRLDWPRPRLQAHKQSLPKV